MKRIPNAREVGQALNAVRAAAKRALRGLNQSAGQLMAKGDYAGAEALAAKGREVQQFQSEVDALRKRWRTLRGTGGDSGPTRQGTTPLWAYYQPILKSLSAAGGESRIAELEVEVERILVGALQPGDRRETGQGRERWQVMIRRARKHLVAEGWIADKPGPVWRITETGRRAAEKPLGPPTRLAK